MHFIMSALAFCFLFAVLYTIPSNRTIVSAPRYFGIKILHVCTLLSQHSVLVQTRPLCAFKADLCDLILP
jgi:hypothetical protein